jgi:tetratricopeptide (TPR) repeat protein
MGAASISFAQGDMRYQDCGNGNQMACFALEFGQCADSNPRVAIAACTRQLSVQDNRVIPGTRTDRATRYALRAYAYAQQRDVERALADYDRAVRTDRNVYWIQIQRANAHFLAGNNEEALDSFSGAVSINPDSVEALIYKSLIQASASEDNLRDPAQALIDAQRVNQLAPGQPAYIDVLAVAYAANGDFAKATEESQRAIDLLPASDLASKDDYTTRLALFRQSLPFRMDP